MSLSNPIGMPTAPQSGRLWVILLAIGCVWGLTAPLSKLAMSSGHHPIGVTFWTAAISTIVFNAALWLRRDRLRLDVRHLRFFLICGLLGTVIPNIASFEAYRHLPVGIMVLCFAGIPITTVFLSAVAGLERIWFSRIVGIAFGAVAMVLIALPDVSVSAEDVVWVALPILAAVAYAAENVFIAAKRPKGTNPLQVMAGLSLAALGILTPLMLALDAGVNITRFGLEELAILATAFLHIVAYFGYVWLIDRAGSVFASQLSYVVTGSGILLGVLIYGERHGPMIWIALALMFSGLALVKPRRISDLE